MKRSGTKSVILGNIFVVLLFFLSFTNAHAQWAYTYGGNVSGTNAIIRQTTDGGFIMAGATQDFGAGGYDIWVFRLDNAGGIVWQKTYGGSNYDYCFDIHETSPDGGYIIAAATGSFDVLGRDFLILKLDSNGSVVWQKTYGGVNNEYPYSIKQTQDGGYIVAGETWSFGQGSVDSWIIKLNSVGEVIWEKTYGGTGYDYVQSIQQTVPDGGYIVAGRTYSFGSGGGDFLVLKLDGMGNITWQKTYGGASMDEAYSIQQTQEGGYIVAGASYSFGSGNMDLLILKLTSSGDVTWQKTYGVSGSDFPACSVQQTQDGGYVVSWSTDSFGLGEQDALIMKLASNGDIEWQKTYGCLGMDWIYSVQQTTDGGYITAGDTNSYAWGQRAIWALKIDSTGSIGSCPFEEIAKAVASDTAVTIVDTGISPITTTSTVKDVAVTIVDTDVSTDLLCAASLGVERLKVGVTKKHKGGGTVTSREGLIDCPGSCQTDYTQGYKVTLFAEPQPLSAFLGWKPDSFCLNENPCTITMDQKKSVKAIFQGPNKLKVVTTFKNGGNGTVTSGDTFINCPGDCEEPYILNAPVTLTANEGVGSTFVKWTGKPCKDQQTNVCTFTMEKNATVKAIFEPTP